MPASASAAPLIEKTTETAREKNRRVEFVVVDEELGTAGCLRGEACWGALSRVWPDWRSSLVLVTPAT